MRDIAAACPQREFLKFPQHLLDADGETCVRTGSIIAR